MAETVEELIQSIRIKCGSPPQDVLGDPAVLDCLYDKITHYRNELNIPSEGWNVSKGLITVQPNRDSGLLTLPDMGRPFFVETFDKSDPRFTRREVRLYRIQDRNLFNVMESNSNLVANNVKHSAQGFAFFGLGTPDANYQVYPTPAEVADYRVWYETILTDEPSIREVPAFMAHFFPLLKVDCQLDLLPMCKYAPESLSIMMSQANATKQQYYMTFRTYIHSIYHADTDDMVAANASRRNWRRWIG